MAACALAGCVSQPARSAPETAPIAAAHYHGGVLRIGIEHLPPEPGLASDGAPRAHPTPPPLRTAAAAAAPQRDVEDRAIDALASVDLDRIDDPVARETMHFVRDLVDTDRRRVQREVGLPFFDFQAEDPRRGPLLAGEEDLRAEHEEWTQQHGVRMLQRPLRQLLRRLPLVEAVELGWQDFRSDHVPLTEPYHDVHGDRRRLGRVSLRLRPHDLADPAELVWIRAGLRVGSSQEVGKLSWSIPLSARITLELRARTEYASGEQTLRADLAYRYSSTTSMHVAAGDDLDFLTTSPRYSMFESPMDNTPGLLLYAVHVF
jgi:hypothetical protein